MKETENVLYRPSVIDGYICGEALKSRVKAHMSAARKKSTLFPHTLLTGPAGTGKTTMANIIARSMDAAMIKFVGQELRDKEQLAVLFSAPPGGAVLFIDEIHSVSKKVMELLYPAMEDGKMPSVGDPNLMLYLNPLTVIGATTEPGSLEKPLLDRFVLKLNIPPYDTLQIAKILREMAAHMSELEYSDGAIYAVANRSKCIPRIAGNLLYQVNDHAIAKGRGTVDQDFVEYVMKELGITRDGLDAVDLKILEILRRNETLGIASLASIIGEDPRLISQVYEPYLIRKGFLIRTRPGRQITDTGRAQLGGKI